MEKDLKKMEEDKKLSLMHLTDMPLNAVAASQSAREKTGKALINLDAKKVSEKELKKTEGSINKCILSPISSSSSSCSPARVCAPDVLLILFKPKKKLRLTKFSFLVPQAESDYM